MAASKEQMAEWSAALDQREDMIGGSEPPVEEPQPDPQPSAEETIPEPDARLEEPAEETEWVTEEIRELASAYNVSSDVLDQISSEDELRGHLNFLDQHQASLMPAQTPKADEAPVEPQAAAEHDPEESTAWEDVIAGLKEDGENTDAMELLYQQNQAQAEALATLQQSIQGQADLQNQQRDRQVGQALDELGHAEVFGTATSFTPEQSNNASLVRDTVQQLVDQGRPLTPALVQRAVNLNFGSQIVKQSQDNKTSRLQAQSKNVMKRGSRAASKGDPPPLDREEAGKDPVLHEAWAGFNSQ